MQVSFQIPEDDKADAPAGKKRTPKKRGLLTVTSMANGVSCACGNKFLEDENFCRKCGKERCVGELEAFQPRKDSEATGDSDDGSPNTNWRHMPSKNTYHENLIAENQELCDKIREFEQKLLEQKKEHTIELEELQEQLEEQKKQNKKIVETKAESIGEPQDVPSTPSGQSSSKLKEIIQSAVKDRISVKEEENFQELEEVRTELAEVQAKYQKAKTEIAALQSEQKKLTAKSNSASTELAKVQKELKEAQVAIQQERKLAREQIEQLQEKVDKLSSDKMVFGVRDRRQKLVTENLMSQLKDPEEDELSEAPDRVQELELEVEQLRCQLWGMGSKDKETQEEIDRTFNERNELMLKIANLQRELAVVRKVAIEWRNQAKLSFWRKLTTQMCAGPAKKFN